MTEKKFPDQARVVVVGGGIAGCSTAYHLAKLGWKDIVLLEQGRLSGGTTWHAAGLVGQLRAHENLTRLIQYSTRLYASLEEETGLATGWKQCGSVSIARTQDRMTVLKRIAAKARAYGVEAEVISGEEAGRLWPVMETKDLVGGVWMPGDGKANPADLTQALARGARDNGVRIFEKTRVTGIELDNGAVSKVATDKGDIRCEYVVNCAGQWARELGRMCGVTVPVFSCEHMYIVSGLIDGVKPNLPCLRDPDGYIYFKEEVGGLVMGGFEPKAKPWVADIPADFEFTLLEDDWDQFEILMENALIRVPALETADVKQFVNGPESFTPDGNFILGTAPECSNMFVGAGFNAFGIASGGGAGWVLAEWTMSGEAPLDLWVVDIRRFSGLHRDRQWVCDRTLEAYGKHYTIGFPHEEYESGRPRIVSPLYERLKAHRAVFGSKLGWERPNWFAPEGMEAKDVYSMGRQNWFGPVGDEHAHVREKVGIFDQSSFAKYELEGADALKALDWICANDVSKPVGRLTYTQLLNSRGGIEADLTVARIAEDRFYIVTGTGYRTHDLAWIADHIPESSDATLTDITEEWGTLSLMGPKARDVLAKVTSADVSHEAFPFGHVREIEIAGHTVRALRVTYVGELGWELHVPIGATGEIFDALMEAGKAEDIRPIGYRALESLRLEKGYRAWSSDITPNDTPFEAGLGWAVKLKKNTDFMGRKALEGKVGLPLTKRLAGFTLDDPDAVLVGRETILRDGDTVGYLTSGGYGYTIGKSVGYGYVRHADGVSDDFLMSGSYELVVANERIPATIGMEPFFDPSNSRVKA